jgi:actin-related protein 4
VRTGFAGEDTPKSIIPSYYAYANGKRSFGDHVIDLPREDVDIRNPMGKDGTVEDWDAAEELWKDSFAAKLTGVRPNRALGEWLNDYTAVPNLRQSMADAVDTERCLEEHGTFLEPYKVPGEMHRDRHGIMGSTRLLPRPSRCHGIVRSR